MHKYPEILITGGTSGLGLELVKVFLNKGYTVVALGRDSSKLPEGYANLKFAGSDFGDLRQTTMITRDLCKTHDFDYVINNAGILSPSRYTKTKDGFEYTFQVNFLAHLLISEVIIQCKKEKLPLIIAAITSPAYRLTGNKLQYEYAEKDYKPLKAYSDSKYFMSLMCRHLSMSYKEKNVIAFSFNPGIFRSGIYRMQNPWFRNMYRIAAPFMRNPVKVAEILAGILEFKNLERGKVYNLRKKVYSLSESYNVSDDEFWDYCFEKIDPFLNFQP